jgi:CubicO group peptidase (beta-lactamase class C family)
MTVPSIASMLEPAAPETVGLSGARLAHLGHVLVSEVEAGRIPGAVVAVARRGRLAMIEAVGRRDPATGAAMTVDAVFSIASMTKVWTSVAALQLFEGGRLLLGDPVAKHLPALTGLRVAVPTDGDRLITAPAKREPTVQDLLRHTSGLTYRDRGRSLAHRLYPGSSISAARDLTREAFLASLAKAPLIHEPGTVWEYGFSTDVLGLLVEAVAGQPLAAYLGEHVWGPLGMGDCAFEIDDAVRSRRYARAFDTDPLTGQRQTVHHALGERLKWDSGGGGAVATAADYLAFAEALRQGGALAGARLLGRKTVALMTADHLGRECDNRIADTMDPACSGYGFGLGVAVRREAGLSAMAGSAGDYYWSGVYGTYFWVDPAEQLSVVFMAAAPGLIRLRYRQLIRALVYQAIAD